MGQQLVARTEKLSKINIFSIIEPLFNLPHFNKIYFGSLRNLDYMLGCSVQCPVCYVDAPILTAMFTTNSLLEAFAENEFKSLLADGIRVGILSDPFDHPDAHDLTTALLGIVGRTLAYNTSVPKDSEDEILKVMAHKKTGVTFRGDIKEYASRLIDAKVDTNFEKLELWLAYKPNNSKRIDKMFRGNFHEWAIGYQTLYLINGGYSNVGVTNYAETHMIRSGRVKSEKGLNLVSPSDDSSLDKSAFPHTQKTIGKGKFIILPSGAYIVINTTIKENPTGKRLVRIDSSNYEALGMKYLINDPNPVYIKDYKPNPFYARAHVQQMSRKTVLGFSD